MKKILVATDFSPSAQTAIEYAVQMAQKCRSKLVLFHAYHTQPISLDIPVVDVSLDDIRVQTLESLQNIRTNLIKQYGDMDIECGCKLGFAVDAINDYAIENDVNIIVMGMQGSSFIGEILVGSITTSLMQHAPCPVLVIGPNMTYQGIHKIVWACDGVKAPNNQVLGQLKKMMATFTGLKIFVANVIPKYIDNRTMFESRVLPVIKIFLQKEDYSVHSIESENIVEGINAFARQENVDLVVMVPRRHAIWRNLFFEPNTKRMAFHSSVPLLIIQQ